MGLSLLTMKISQQDVSPTFKNARGVYVDYDGRPIRLRTVPMGGSSTSDEMKATLSRRPKRVLLNANNDVPATQK